MPEVQATYKTSLDAFRAGQIVDMSKSTVLSRTVETAAGIPFGAPVIQGTLDRQAKIAATGATKILGVAVRDRSAVGVLGGDGQNYAQYEEMGVLVDGPIAVIASVAVVAGDIVHVIVATAAWAKTGGVLVPNARWETTAGIGELAVVHFGVPA